MYFDKYNKLSEYRYTRDYKNTNPVALEFADWMQIYIEKEGKWEGMRKREIWKYQDGILIRPNI